MEREEIKVYFPYLKAFAEGKEIQCDVSGEWRDTEVISLSIGVEHYRIKPAPKYRPFKTKEECWIEMHKHPDFGWVINEGVYMIVQSIYNDEIYTAELLDNIDYKYAVENLIFTDGTPFGIKEE